MGNFKLSIGVVCLSLMRIGVAQNNDGEHNDYLNSMIYLSETGWYKSKVMKDLSTLSTKTLKEQIRMPLKRMKSFYMEEATQDGELTEEAKAFMAQPRCAVPDNSDDESAISNQNILTRHKRYSYLGGQIWRKFPLTIGFNNYTTAMPKRVQNRVAKACAAKWADVSGLSFRFVRNRIANIHISFVTFRTKSGQVEGRYNVVGRAINPVPNRKPPSSWIQMDLSEVWKPRASSRHNDRNALSLEEGLCHEIGHTLGLGHSKERGSIMYPVVGFRSKNVELGQDDIAGIQSHYGKPNSKQATPSPRTPSRNPERTNPRPDTTTATTTEKPTDRTGNWRGWIPHFNRCSRLVGARREQCLRSEDGGTVL